MKCPYAELHAHSNFSFLEGASHIEELVLRARELGYEALALTDHDGLHGAMEFAQCARAWGLRPITGAEVTLSNGGGYLSSDLRDKSRSFLKAEGFNPQRCSGHHLTLLCETQRGYANLCRLLTHAHLDHERGEPCIEPDVLARHTEGLIALSGCRRGEVPSLVAEGRYREAEEAARRYVEMFGRQNFFIELQNNLVHGDARRNRAWPTWRSTSGSASSPRATSTTTCGSATASRTCWWPSRTAPRWTPRHRLRRENSEYYLKPPAEMAELFRDVPVGRDYPEAIANTVRIAERCTFDLTRDLDYRFPATPVPEGETPDSYLRQLCYREARGRYGRITPEVRDRLEEELRLVEQHGLAGFFLIHREILQLAYQVAEEVRGRPATGPPGRGRGVVRGLAHLLPDRPVAHRPHRRTTSSSAASSTRRWPRCRTSTSTSRATSARS